ncbi:hypothetical protein [Nocardia asteroides]|uniref:hypothetical protein n=1 Tax=Nocardia asteroides TaxID=1824 RepID=UPI001E4272B3|nr:hypothetical protein [Nocardia asteroides]UGT62120.1 hypothetical protein LTT61_01845 [Nocardia asteroides]
MCNRAIGLIHLGLPGNESTHCTVIDDLARAETLQLAEVVTIGHDTYMPITYIITAAARVGAEVVIAPDLAHFGTGYTAMTLACGLLIPTGLIPRRRQQPALRAARDTARYVTGAAAL